MVDMVSNENKRTLRPGSEILFTQKWFRLWRSHRPKRALLSMAVTELHDICPRGFLVKIEFLKRYSGLNMVALVCCRAPLAPGFVWRVFHSVHLQLSHPNMYHEGFAIWRLFEMKIESGRTTSQLHGPFYRHLSTCRGQRGNHVYRYPSQDPQLSSFYQHSRCSPLSC